MATEIWKAIGEAPAYEVSNLGNVRRVVPDKLGRMGPPMLATPLNDKGYRHLNLHFGGRQHLRRVHHLVCEAFHGPRPSLKHQVRHLDGNKTNNNAENLAWGTNGQNSLDTVANGGGAQILRGTKRPRYSIDIIKDIKFSRKSQPQLVREHGVSKGLIHRIRHGFIHKNVEIA